MKSAKQTSKTTKTPEVLTTDANNDKSSKQNLKSPKRITSPKTKQPKLISDLLNFLSPRKQKTFFTGGEQSSLLGQGTYGCVYMPYKDENNRSYSGYITKVMLKSNAI